MYFRAGKDSLRHLEELVGLWLPNASNELLKVADETSSSTWRDDKRQLLETLIFKKTPK